MRVGIRMGRIVQTLRLLRLQSLGVLIRMMLRGGRLRMRMRRVHRVRRLLLLLLSQTRATSMAHMMMQGPIRS